MASNTSSAWPSTLTLRHSRRKTPTTTKKNKQHTTPNTTKPNKNNNKNTTKSLQTLSSTTTKNSKGKACFSLKPACDCTLSREMPSSTVSARLNASCWSRKFCPSSVQPGVL